METYQFLIFLALVILTWRLFKLEKRVRKIEDLIDEACDEMEEEENENKKTKNKEIED